MKINFNARSQQFTEKNLHFMGVGTFLPHYWNTKNWHLFPEFFSAYYLETLSLTTACLFLSWSLGLFLFGENFHIEWVFRTPVNGTGTFSAFTAAYGMSESAHKM